MKPRDEHERKRGVKKMTLDQLSRELPTGDELANFTDILWKEPSDRTAAIMASSLVENALKVCLCSRLVFPESKIVEGWFEGLGAPFGTFSAKITLGRAIGIYGPKTEETLKVLKNVRNVFAHRAGPIDFSNPTLQKEVVKLSDAPLPNDQPHRTRYSATCFRVATMFINDGFEQGDREIALSFP